MWALGADSNKAVQCVYAYWSSAPKAFWTTHAGSIMLMLDAGVSHIRLKPAFRKYA